MEVAALILLLLVECEPIILGHLRMVFAFGEFFGFSLFRLSVILLVLCLLDSRRQKWGVPVRLSLPYVVLHAAFALTLNAAISPLWHLAQRSPGWHWLWVPLIGGFMASWVAALIPPGQWPGHLKRQGWRLLGLMPFALILSWTNMANFDLWRMDTASWLVAPTFACSSAMLALIFPSVISDPVSRLLGPPEFQIVVKPLCSGAEGIALTTGYLLVFLWLRRDRLQFPQAFLLLPLGVGLSFLFNTIRLAGLVMVGALVSKNLALEGGFHTHAGWISFNLLSWILILTVEKLGWFQRSREQVDNPSLPFLLPLATLLFSWMLTQAFTVGFDVGYPLRVLVVGAVLALYHRAYRPLLTKTGGGAIAIGVVVYLIWILLVPAPPAPELEPWSYLGSWAWCWIGFRFLGSVVVIPIVEELAFRGFLLRRLQAREFESVPLGALTPLALILSSLAFGVLHQQWLAATIAGLAYGYATKLRGHLSAAVVAHATTNLLLAAQVLIFHQWSLWA